MPIHASHLLQSCLVKHQITQVTQPLYSPDLVCCDFWLFSKLKYLWRDFKGKRLQTIDEIQENMMGKLMVIESTVWGPKVPRMKGTELSLSYVQCLWYFVLSLFEYFIYLFLERGEGREKEREININLWLPLMCPQLGTWPITQACALIGNRTGDTLVHRSALNPLRHTIQGCFLYFVSSSLNVSIFHITWLDTFWTDLIYTYT